MIEYNVVGKPADDEYSLASYYTAYALPYYVLGPNGSADAA